MSKSIIFAGYTRVNGQLKFRTATTEARVHQLEALGENDIHMIRIDPVLSKGDAARALLGMDHAKGNVEVEQLYIKMTPGAKINKKEVIVKVPPKFLQELIGAKVKVSRGVYAKVFPEIPMTPKQAERIRNEFNAQAKDLV
jgi:hypothetical protein